LAGNLKHITNPKIPQRIQELNEISFNLSWSWDHETRKMFKSLDRPLWKTTIHNPVKLLNQIEPYRLVAAGQDANFLNNYDTIVARFRNESINGENWCQTHYPLLTKRIVAYFSMEFAIHSSLPLYAGGLGVLAGDYCKEASDLGLPIIGIGFLYPQGYFRQRISEDGWQEEDYRQLNFS
jgi:glycogen phosphorylase